MYEAILIAPDGDWVTDFKRDTKEEVLDELADMGSRWVFYPYAAVIKSSPSPLRLEKDLRRRRVLDAWWPFADHIGKSVGSLLDDIKSRPLRDTTQQDERTPTGEPFHPWVMKCEQCGRTFTDGLDAGNHEVLNRGHRTTFAAIYDPR